MIKVFARKPVKALAAQYDGTISDGRYLMGWVKRQGRRQTLEPEGQDGRLVLSGSDGTTDLFEGWWLVFDDNKFESLTPEEFHARYEEKKG